MSRQAAKSRGAGDRPQVSFEIDPETREALDRLIEREAAESGTPTSKLQAPVIRKAIRRAAAALPAAR